MIISFGLPYVNIILSIRSSPIAQRKILITLNKVELSDHDDRRALIFTDHLPKILKCVDQWTLSGNKCCNSVVLGSLYKTCIDVIIVRIRTGC
uniref:Uncharacterized protein n=1 Tax=Arundo donax TaxID=35708 RepID=A0A0A9E8F4_ARUDO